MDLYHQFQTATALTSLIPFIQIHVYNFETIIENSIKDLMRTILLKRNKCLKLCIISNNIYHLANYILLS